MYGLLNDIAPQAKMYGDVTNNVYESDKIDSWKDINDKEKLIITLSRDRDETLKIIDNELEFIGDKPDEKKLLKLIKYIEDKHVVVMLSKGLKYDSLFGKEVTIRGVKFKYYRQVKYELF
jgi:hypothetical protein